MAEPEWSVFGEAGRVRVMEAPQTPLEPPVVHAELTDPLASPRPGEPRTLEEMQRFARQVVDWLEQALAEARFEYLRIAAEPRFLPPLRREIEQHLDLHRAVLEWRPLDVVPLDAAEAMRQMGAPRG